MNTASVDPSGWFETLRRIGESLSALLRCQFELFTVEYQEEKLRLLNLLVWMGLAAAVGVSGVLIALVVLAFWLWTLAGYAGPIGLAIVALAAAVCILWRVRRRIQTGPTPFAQTVAELRKDGECLRGVS